ncbi:hypothetical protein [Sagittula salina]|uniref:Uncharacterized protein n=1 Tax=Sagittula salina TaxID=2820268 RepID=A0A940MPL9_9RHOB|nr:hypothetical protein [Sagittula salina]MBP0481827.1 hypothetical protein [Sagittula salina]
MSRAQTATEQWAGGYCRETRAAEVSLREAMTRIEAGPRPRWALRLRSLAGAGALAAASMLLAAGSLS